MTACAQASAPPPQIIPEIHNIYPSVPANLLICADEPTVPDILTDVDAAQFTEAVRMAGAACRGNLGALKAFVDSWPKP